MALQTPAQSGKRCCMKKYLPNVLQLNSNTVARLCLAYESLFIQCATTMDSIHFKVWTCKQLREFRKYCKYHIFCPRWIILVFVPTTLGLLKDAKLKLFSLALCCYIYRVTEEGPRYDPSPFSLIFSLLLKDLSFIFAPFPDLCLLLPLIYVSSYIIHSAYYIFGLVL